MGWFSKGKSGGMMNVIRCDEPEYLVWKWRPAGQGANTTSRENTIRWGSSLRVKDGEVAVFIYKQKGGTLQDFIEGPFDATLKTANFPVLSGILGAAYGGDSPFQAEVYFINLAGNVQIKFAVPYFDVIDPRFTDIIVPVAAGGSITFNLTDYRAFVKLNRLIHFSLDDFKNQIRDVVIRRMKEAIANAPADMGIPLVQIDRKIGAINDLVAGKLKTDLEDFGVNLKRLDISRIEPDKESEGWEQLRSITANATIDTIKAQNAINIKNLQDTQAMNAENMAETMRIQREEMQRAQRLQSETNFIGAHTLDQQTDVLKTGAQNLGMMGTMNMGSDGSMNPAGMMTGMMMGGAMGQQMAGMMSNMGQQVQNGMNTPPPVPNVSYFVEVNGAQSGPFNMQQLQQMAQSGQLTPQTYIWKQGMANWALAKDVQELSCLFAPPAPGSTPPPVPPTKG